MDSIFGGLLAKVVAIIGATASATWWLAGVKEDVVSIATKSELTASNAAHDAMKAQGDVEALRREMIRDHVRLLVIDKSKVDAAIDHALKRYDDDVHIGGASPDTALERVLNMQP